MNTADSPHVQRWALLVGIDGYDDNTIADWPAAASNLEALHAQLVKQSAYGPERVQVLGLRSLPQSAPVTRLHILRALSTLSEQAGPNDLLLFYFTGCVRIVDGQTFLLPSDAINSDLLPDTALPFQRVKDLIQRSNARARVMILDVFDADTARESRSISPNNSSAFFESIFAAPPEAALWAAFSPASAQHASPCGASPFTQHLADVCAQAIKESTANPVPLRALADEVSYQVNRKKSANIIIKYVEPAGQTIFPFAASRVMESEWDAGHQTSAPVLNPVSDQFPMAVQQKEDFFGRSQELERVRRILRTPVNKPIVVQGERCIGKTSFLNRAKILLDEWQEQPFLHFSIEPSSVHSCEAFARALWFGISSSIRGIEPDQIQPAFEFNSFAGFVDRLNALSEPFPDKRFVVFIDELDKIIRQCQKLEYVSILGLILYIVEQTRFPLLFFVSIVQDFPDDPGSPFTSSADFFVLHTFDQADTQDLIHGLLKDHIEISPECIDWIYDYTGGHPYFTKLLLTQIFESNLIDPARREITLEILQTVAQHAVHSRSADDLVRNIYSVYLDDDQRSVLLWLACRDGALQQNDIRGTTVEIRTAMRELARRDYVTSPDSQQCKLRIQFFRDWLRHWSRFELEVERLRITCDRGIAPPPTGICIDLSTQVVYVDGVEIAPPLSNELYRALLFLATHRGRVVSKVEFANHVWATDHYIGDDTRISTLISRLRKRLNGTQESRDYIETKRGIGFLMKDVTLIHSIPLK